MKDENLHSHQQDVDIWMLRENLKLSYEDRIDQHQETLDFIHELNKIGWEHRAKSSKNPRNFDQKPD